MTIDDAFQRLRTILTNEQHTLVRKAALNAVIGQGSTYFTPLKDIIPSISHDEMHDIVNTLVEIYRTQRRALPGGDTHLPDRSGKLYPLWLRPWERPRTDIEQAMLDWSTQDSADAITQQIAWRALSQFPHEFDEEALRRREWSAQNGTPSEAAEPIHSPRMNGLHPANWFIYHVVPWMVTMDAPHYRAIIRGVLPEVLAQHRSSPTITTALFRDFEFLSDSDIVEVTRRLHTAIRRAAHRNWLIGGCIGIVLIGGIVVFSVMRVVF
jgi:hypothetical protein